MARNEGNARDNYDVVIVGAGTTGLALANLLDRRGMRVAVIDPIVIPCHHPRGAHIDDECVRLLQTLGMGGVEKTYMAQTGLEIFSPEGERLVNWDVPAHETDQGYQLDYQFFQPDLEATLRGRLAASRHADLWLGWKATEVRQDGDSTLLTARHRRNGSVRTITSAWVVGCDGANSRLREHVSDGMRDLEGSQRSVIVDVHKFVPITALPATSTYIRSGALPFTHQPAANGISRFQFMLIGDDDPTPFEDPEVIYDLLAPYLAPDSYRILRTDVYDWHARLARGWRSGRLLIAGDAAHQMPPLLGQGMCSGLRDAANLAWKLAAVVRGAATADLLDTYESERAPHVEDLITESARQSRMIAAAGRGEPIAATGVVDRRHGPLGPGLGLAHPLRGTLSPQPRDTGGTLMDDLVGYEFAVLGSTRVLDAVDTATRERWARLGAVTLPDFAPRATRWLADAGADAAIVRPDRYVFAATAGADALASATTELIDQLTGKAVGVA
ncbi:3-(3-hydroxyphenyl)propionate hydroxylase [Streptomyces sulfonofaciens]|uniref:3-(3-hydroxyphenyl)propionate hydroxylase n=1 Tax=Streptomyces sulfonofaciens TaxID=68272 RepID=A0A919GPE7_9ACTN|nr:bifunctional 3-(3-hydroxy-phenyl)propionate/3-hydroxycinnamic acid hydroxylase [Streptomyces sulfonofaciens]GHH87435.1 3-(3-hydroxyphenyl)propionate hydroxylase [Streptomyces sulfonofaciens]